MQIITTMIYYLIPVKMARLKKIRKNEDVEKKETSCTISGNVNQCSHWGK